MYLRIKLDGCVRDLLRDQLRRLDGEREDQVDPGDPPVPLQPRYPHPAGGDQDRSPTVGQGPRRAEEPLLRDSRPRAGQGGRGGQVSGVLCPESGERDAGVRGGGEAGAVAEAKARDVVPGFMCDSVTSSFPLHLHSTSTLGRIRL